MSNSAILNLFEHNVWANLKLLDTCSTLDETKLAEHDPAVYGSIKAMLVHIVNAERYYIWLMSGSPGARTARLPVTISLPELRAIAEAGGNELLALAGRADELAHATILDDEAPPAAMPVVYLLTQAIHHGNEHRTNITTLLARLGEPECDLSSWCFWRSRMAA